MNRLGLYLRWGGGRNRANDLADALGTRLVSFGWKTKNPVLVPLRYAVQFAQTFDTLSKNEPDVVVTQHTQPFCSLAAVFYTKLFGGVVVTDCHNGPFVDTPWTRWPLNVINRYVYKSATINLVHNEGMRGFAEAQQSQLGSFRVLHDPVPDLQTEGVNTVADQVIAICSFHHDEPIDALLAGAALAPEISFRITGDTRRLSAAQLAKKPANVEFTGFLADADYDALLQCSTAAIALSTRDNLLMRACQEAIGAGVPFITSDGPVARDYLTQGAVFVDNSPQSIADGARRAVAEGETLRLELAELREQLRVRWLASIAKLKADLGLSEG
ncbi:MAG: glycosyltransferase [Polyangiaceae bacterium]|nr:glycosyltransferase [Polyangiaceae bacterium]